MIEDGDHREEHRRPARNEQAGYIDILVAAGACASGSEVVRAGSRALQERDAAVEEWLREEVVSVCAAKQSDPGRAVPAEQVFAAIRPLRLYRRTRGLLPQSFGAFRSAPEGATICALAYGLSASSAAPRLHCTMQNRFGDDRQRRAGKPIAGELGKQSPRYGESSRRFRTG